MPQDQSGIPVNEVSPFSSNSSQPIEEMTPIRPQSNSRPHYEQTGGLPGNDVQKPSLRPETENQQNLFYVDLTVRKGSRLETSQTNVIDSSSSNRTTRHFPIYA